MALFLKVSLQTQTINEQRRTIISRRIGLLYAYHEVPLSRIRLLHPVAADSDIYCLQVQELALKHNGLHPCLVHTLLSPAVRGAHGVSFFQI